MSTATTPKRGPYARTRQRREQIALAVLELVDEVGHEGVTTAQVAARAHTAEPTVLYHFPSKDHLLVAALERADDIDAALAGAEEPDAALELDTLRQVAEASLRENERRIRLYVMLKGQVATPDHPAAAHFRQRTERIVGIYTRLVAERQHRGLAHPGLDPADAAKQMIALWDGLVAMWVTDHTLDVGALLISGVRRLTGENWMRARALLDEPEVGL